MTFTVVRLPTCVRLLAQSSKPKGESQSRAVDFDIFFELSTLSFEPYYSLTAFIIELMTIATRKFLVIILGAIVLSLGLPRTGFSLDSLYTVTSPKRFQKFHSYPVDIVVQFSQDARAETFMASLNGTDITSRFERTKNEARALVGPEDGLSIEVGTDSRQKINMLRTNVKGLEEQQDVDSKTFFFVEVDQLVTIGPKGDTIQSLDGNLVIDIPPEAISSTTGIALTRVRGFGHTGVAYDLAPRGIYFNEPVTVSMKYDPTNLPPDVPAGDLFLLAEHEFPERLENLSVDETAYAVNGTVSTLSKVFMSYYMKIGKKLGDIPTADDFRLPIGDSAYASYTCGQSYEVPGKNDRGEILALLRRSLHPNDDPKITFNQNEPDHMWEVIRGFNRRGDANLTSDRTGERPSLHKADQTRFNSGEDWHFQDRENVHQSLPIRAIADGLVVYNGRSYGNTVVLAHQIPAGPIFSIYSYMAEKSPCATGAIVRKGNVIGKVGRVPTRQAYLHFEVGRQSLIKVDTETGEIKVPAVWFSESKQDSIYENYYDPTNFLLNAMGKYRWDFDTNGNDEGWAAGNVERYEDGYFYQVKDGVLSLKPTSNLLRIVSYPLRLDPKSFDSVFIRMRGNAPDGRGKVYFATAEAPQFSEDRAVELEMLDDGEFHEYRALVENNAEWKGVLVGIRIDLPDTVIGESKEIDFDSIRLGRAYLSRTPDTGQASCYDDSREIACPAPGEAFYGQDANYVINPPSYEVQTIEGQEVVIDHVTGLTWQRNDDGTKRTWQEAMDYCENLMVAGYSDWRVPTKKELQSISYYGGSRPALDTAYFPYPHLHDDYYWSSNTRSFLALSALKVCFWNNQVAMGMKSDPNYVRAVRGRPLEFGHFTDNGDGTVTDITTGLVWQQGEAKAMTWEKALAYCENLDLAGYRDWRLPNIRELLSLVDDDHLDPSIDADYFPGCRPSPYWSGTSHSLYPGFAWHVAFDDGCARGGGHKGRRLYVRAVRGGE